MGNTKGRMRFVLYLSKKKEGIEKKNRTGALSCIVAGVNEVNALCSVMFWSSHIRLQMGHEGVETQGN